MSPATPVPPSPSLAGPRPLRLVDGNVHSPAVSSCPSPTLSGLSTPPPSARKFHSHRQSSISYYPSDHSPSWDIRSPTTSSRPSSLRRSTSLSNKTPARLDLKGDRRSLPLSEEPSPQPERSQLTLTEKCVLSTHHTTFFHLPRDAQAYCLSSFARRQCGPWRSDWAEPVDVL